MHRPFVGNARTFAHNTTPRLVRWSLAALLVAAALLALAVGNAAATTNGVCGALSVSNPSGSAGTASDPCLITSDADLDAALAQINADSSAKTEAADSATGAASAYYELTANLNYAQDSSNTTNASTAQWTGINWFDGTFNGNGYAISNLTYATTASTFTPTLPASVAAAYDDLGFFRVLDGATVENLTLSNANAGSSTSAVAAGGVAAASFASTITGVTVSSPSIVSTGGGGASYVGGVAGIAYSNDYADYSAADSDGNTTTFADDAVTGGKVSAYNRLGGLVGLTEGPTTISDNYVDTALSNPDHDTDGSADYGLGGLVGTVNGTYALSAGGSAAGTAISNNAIQGSIDFGDAASGQTTAAPASSGTANYTSPTIGYTTTTGTWTESNNLVSSAFSYTNVSPTTGISGVDGLSVSPATLETESTFSGSTAGVEDSATTTIYDQLGWNFTIPQAGEWAWTGSGAGAAPALAQNPTVALADSTVSAQINSEESAAAIGAAAGATVSFTGSPLTAADVSWSISGTITWSTPGSYPVELVATLGQFSASIPVTVDVTASIALNTTSTYTAEATTSPPSVNTILSALGATLPPGVTGPMSIDLTAADPGDSAVNFDAPGTYPVTVYDTNASDEVTSVSATIVVLPVPVVTVTASTLYYNGAQPPTAAGIVSASGAQLTNGSGGAVSGQISANPPAAVLAGTAGTYTVELTGTDTAGFEGASVPVTVYVSAATLTVTDTTPVFQVTAAAPSSQAVLTALGATLTASGNGGTAAVDLTGTAPGDATVNFDQPGEYHVTVSDTDADDVVTPIGATIEVIPPSVITTANPTVYFNTGTPPTAATVLAAAGAQLTDGSGNAVSGQLSATLSQPCGTTAGTCTATINGIDAYGFKAAPVTVTVDVSSATVVVANSTARFAASATAPASNAILSALGAAVYGSTGGGSAVIDSTGVNWDVPGTYSVSISDSDADDRANTETATIQIVPAPIVMLLSTVIFLPVNVSDPLPASLLVADSGAILTDGQGNSINGTISADASQVNGTVPGSYPATIIGTDAYGVQSAPVSVTVVIYEPAQASNAGSVTVSPDEGTNGAGTESSSSVNQLTWTPANDELAAGVRSAKIIESTRQPVGAAITVKVAASGAKRTKTTIVRVVSTHGYRTYSYSTGKLRAGKTVIRFYKKSGRRLVLIRTERITVRQTGASQTRASRPTHTTGSAN